MGISPAFKAHKKMQRTTPISDAPQEPGLGESTPASEPRVEYSRRIAARDAEAERLSGRHVWIGNARLILFIGIFALCWKIGKTGAPSLIWLVAAVFAFFLLGRWDSRTLRDRNRARRAASFYRRGLARIEDRWAGTGEDGREFQSPDHLYADDLDILGEGSLFQLLCTARTQMGKAHLASWLLAPAVPEEVAQRQVAVEELAGKLDLRENLSVSGESDRIEADSGLLAQWAKDADSVNYRRWWPFTLVLAALSIVCLVYALMRGFWTPFLFVQLVNANIAFWQRQWLARMFGGLDLACKNLESLACVIERIEQESFESPENRSLQAKLMTGGVKASECIARLAKLSQLADSRRNLMVAAFNVPLLYTVHVAFALQWWKDRFAAGVPNWIEAIGRMEALASVAAYKFEHPQDPFPDFSPNEAPCFEGEELGHPLLPASVCVRNAISLRKHSIWLVSGSNMSGKSTFLRAVGVNAVLAMMGAPVRASRLRLSPLDLGAAIRVSDSLQKGVSHFYAEIQRIRRVVELSSGGRALFLFDEILQGTNSHDRRVGAEGILRALIRNGAIGLATTHDLALTSLAEVFPEYVYNAHFQEKFESGKLAFDYRLRDGVVRTSNGIELMKSIGLEV
jgi:hypothetical protein